MRTNPGRAAALLASLIVGSSLVACALSSDDEVASQEGAHTEGEPTFAQYPWLWADESEEEFRQNAEQTSGWDGLPRFIPLDHPMTTRLQFWLDQMDETLREKYPDKLRATPRPRIIIQNTDEANAWVSFLPVTFDVRARLPKRAVPDAGVNAPVDGGDVDAGPAAPPSTAAILLSRQGSIAEPHSGSFPRTHDATTLRDLTTFFNGSFAKCQLTFDGDTMVLGDGCQRNQWLRAETSERFGYYATAKYITFTTGYLLEMLDEDRIVSTLAHELGHYYRSHANMPTDVVNYFYSLEGAHAHKPAPDPRYIEQTAKARDKIRNPSWPEDWSEENELMAQRGLGFYTTEQEADEIALELVSKVGIPPGVAVEKVLATLKTRQDMDEGLDFAECSTLREQGFRDESGKLVVVPVGDPSNAHHNLCFRAFNMSREIAAHRYTVGARPAPPDGASWSQLVTRLAAEVDPNLARPHDPQPDAGD